MHDIIATGPPLIVILAGIIFNRNENIELRTETKELCTEITRQLGDVRSELRTEIQAQNDIALIRHSEVLSRLNRIDENLRQFYHLTGKHEGQIDAIEKRLG